MALQPLASPDAPQRHIARDRIVQRISDAAAYPVVLITASAGYGKSTALKQFQHSSRTPHVWIDIAKGWNRDTALRALLEALDGVSHGEPAEVLEHVSAVIARYAGRIIIDGIDRADDVQGVVDALLSLIEQSPRRVQWILSARSHAAIPVGRLVAHQYADHPIDEGVLEFTPADLRDYADLVGYHLSETDVERIIEFVHGWPFGAVLAVKAHAWIPELPEVELATVRHAAPFLDDEVTSTLTEAQRDLLFTVSVMLGTVRPNVVQAVLRREPAHDLRNLSERVPLVREIAPGEYLVAPIMRDYARSHMRVGHRDVIYESLGRAYRYSGDEMSAIAVYVENGDFEVAVALMHLHLVEWYNTTLPQNLAAVLDRFPSTIRGSSATTLLCDAAIADVAGNDDLALELARRARAAAQNDIERLTAAAFFCAASIRVGRPVDAEILTSLVTDSPAAAAYVNALLANVHIVNGNPEGAREALSRATAAIADEGVTDSQANVFYWMAFALFRLGDYGAAYDLCQRILSAENRRTPWLACARAHDLLSLIELNRRAKLHLVMGHNSDAVVIARECHVSPARFLRRRCIFLFYSGEAALAAFSMDTDETAQLGLTTTYTAIVRFLNYIEDGNIRAALPWIRQLADDPIFIEDPLVPLSCLVLVAALNRDPETNNYVARLRAARRVDQNDTEPVFSNRLERHRRIAQISELLAATFVGEVKTIAEMARVLDPPYVGPVTAVMSAIVRTVITSVREAAPTPPQDHLLFELRDSLYGVFAALLDIAAAQTATLSGIPSLSATEIAILKDLQGGLKPKQIACNRKSSEHTVRTHIKNIFRKLDVRSRLEAITRAQRLGILSQ